jgi:hypothetical protein
MSATVAVSARRARQSVARPKRSPRPFPFPEPASERQSLRAYRTALGDAARTLSFAERTFAELSHLIDAHVRALAALGVAVQTTRTRGLLR